MTDSRQQMANLQLIALGALLASPRLLKDVEPEDFLDNEIGNLVRAMKCYEAGGERIVKQWFLNCGITCEEGGILNNVLKAVALDARHFREMKFATEMTLGGRLLEKKKWLKKMAAHKWA